MIVIKVLIQRISISMISVYAWQRGLDDSLINFVKELGENEYVVVAGDLNFQVVSHPEDYEDQHRGYGFGVKNKAGEQIVEFWTAMNFVPRNSVKSDFRWYINKDRGFSQKDISVEG